MKVTVFLSSFNCSPDSSDFGDAFHVLGSAHAAATLQVRGHRKYTSTPWHVDLKCGGPYMTVGLTSTLDILECGNGLGRQARCNAAADSPAAWAELDDPLLAGGGK